MPPVRTMPAAKPVKTERTHEENQERAYIAASRRSDRSLEARVESARRASEIHKRRTGRSLRVTEQDVVNEEMYEEEDDDLPMQYRRLTAHLQTQNVDFNRRLEAYLTGQVAMRNALGEAVSNANMWQNNLYQQPGQQFMNPGMMQMQQPNFHNQMMPPQMMSRSPTTYRQQPYPMPNANGMRHSIHNRSVSVATPLDTSVLQQQHSQSAQTSPVDTMNSGDRRMSLPVQSVLPTTPLSQHGAPQSNRVSPVISRTPSASNLAKTHSYFKKQSPQQQSTQPAQPQPQQARQASFPSPFNVSSGFHQDADNGMGFNPMSSILPMETQQLLAGNQSFSNGDPFAMMMQSQGLSKPSQPFYSYNPNGKSKSNSASPPSVDGMNSTLAPAMLDTSAGGFTKTPDSAITDSAIMTPFSPAGFGFGFDSGYGGFDMLKDSSSGFTSGQVTPGEHDWQGLIETGAWEEQAIA